MDEKNKRKLLLMVPMLHQGGFERVCVETARLLKDDMDVTILIFSDRDINYDVRGLRIVNIDVPSVSGKAGKAVNVLRRIRKVRAFKKREHFDISYSFGSSANLINCMSRCGEKVVTGIRCQTDLEEEKQVRFFCARSDRVLSCSRQIMQQLANDFDYHRSLYIYNPLDVADIRKKAQEKVDDFPFEADASPMSTEEGGNRSRHLIVSLGRDDYIKGNWHLVKAFSLVQEQYPDARLMIFGAGRYEGCRKLARDLGIEEKCAFPGVRRNPFPYTAQADLYVLPSNHEGFPNALLEALALGLPAVAADCRTGPREILLSDAQLEALNAEKPDGSSITKITEGEYGVLVPDMDEHPDYSTVITDADRTLAQAILQLFDHPEQMAVLRKKAQQRAVAYTPGRYRKRALEVFEEIINDRG